MAVLLMSDDAVTVCVCVYMHTYSTLNPPVVVHSPTVGQPAKRGQQGC